jgi:hypothetical protein
MRRRCPFKLRGDGRPKDLSTHRSIARSWPWAIDDPDGGVGYPPSPVSALRTRSKAWRAGTRRTRQRARGAR